MTHNKNQSKKSQPKKQAQKQLPTSAPPKQTHSKNEVKQWCFEAIDTWFFREMRPIDELTGAELGSLFPPPARTIAGAVRGLIGERVGVNWAAYRDDGKAYNINGLNLYEQIGNPQCKKGEAEFGQLNLTGPYLLKDGKRLYPVPQHLLHDEEENFYWLEPGEPICCDLGKVRLPVVSPETDKKVKPLNAWVDAENLQKILRHQKPDNKIYHSTDLFANETRIGIGLNRDQRMTIDGLLYQTRHIRPCERVALGVEVAGIDDQLQLLPNETYSVRLGGEGRMAAVKLGTAEKLPQSPVTKETKKIILALLTPLLVPEKGEFFMPFEQAKSEKDSEGTEVWHVTLNDVKLKIISAVLGKPQREGGWNLAKNQSRPLRSLVPAGSVWFCEVLDGNPQTLHGHKVGEEIALGRGELAVGFWQSS